MKETDTHYFFWKHNFAQWSPRDMVDSEDIQYNCCEQYMMANKAKLFGDQKSFELIMNEVRPRQQKKLGRQIENYDQYIWDKNKENIVFKGNWFKFSQSEDLGNRLIDTYPKKLVEASPYDCIWGVGLREEDPLILNEVNWRGQNLLGRTLDTVRSDLIKLRSYTGS